MMNWLLPPCCVLCGNLTHSSDNICAACQKTLPILPEHCPQCARFLPTMAGMPNLGIERTHLNKRRCGVCLNQEPPFDITYALFPYEAPIIQLIIKLKFQQQLSHAQALGSLMAKSITTEWYRDMPLPEVILPIPLHPSRLRERGFNQALEIAKPIAKRLALPLDHQGIGRQKATQAQSGLSAEDRKKNIAEAFVITGNYTGLRVAVIDDVITTGLTMAECCKVLKRQGVARIDVWCCARRG